MLEDKLAISHPFLKASDKKRKNKKANKIEKICKGGLIYDPLTLFLTEPNNVHHSLP